MFVNYEALCQHMPNGYSCQGFEEEVATKEKSDKDKHDDEAKAEDENTHDISEEERSSGLLDEYDFDASDLAMFGISIPDSGGVRRSPAPIERLASRRRLSL